MNVLLPFIHVNSLMNGVWLESKSLPTPLALFGVGIGWAEVALLFAILLLLFGAKRIPALFRAFGECAGVCKREFTRNGTKPDQSKRICISEKEIT